MIQFCLLMTKFLHLQLPHLNQPTTKLKLARTQVNHPKPNFLISRSLLQKDLFCAGQVGPEKPMSLFYQFFLKVLGFEIGLLWSMFFTSILSLRLTSFA